MNAKYINYTLSAFVIVVCIVWSYFLLFSNEFAGNIPPSQRKILTGVLLTYAAFRAYRLYHLVQRYKNNKEE